MDGSMRGQGREYGRGGFRGGQRNDDRYGENFGSDDQTTEEMAIPREHVGRIIGKGGNRIRELQERSGATIQVNSRESGPDGDDTKALVRISGSDYQRNSARQLINDIVSNVPSGGGGYDRGGRGQYDQGGSGGRW